MLFILSPDSGYDFIMACLSGEKDFYSFWKRPSLFLSVDSWFWIRHGHAVLHQLDVDHSEFVATRRPSGDVCHKIFLDLRTHCIFDGWKQSLIRLLLPSIHPPIDSYGSLFPVNCALSIPVKFFVWRINVTHFANLFYHAQKTLGVLLG